MAITISALRNNTKEQKAYLLQLATWHHNEWLHLNPDSSLDERVARYQQSILDSGLPEIFIACDNDKLLGSVTLDKSDMDTRPYFTPWLASLFVEPSSRTQGVASKLIQYCLSYAKEKNYKNVYLFTEYQTEFYKKCGWNFVETLEYRGAEVDLMRQHIN